MLDYSIIQDKIIKYHHKDLFEKTCQLESFIIIGDRITEHVLPKNDKINNNSIIDIIFL